MEPNLSNENQLKPKGSLFYLEYSAIAWQAAAIMSHSKEINETSNRQLQITHVELKLYSDACSESTLQVLPCSSQRVYHLFNGISVMLLQIGVILRAFHSRTSGVSLFSVRFRSQRATYASRTFLLLKHLMNVTMKMISGLSYISWPRPGRQRWTGCESF